MARKDNKPYEFDGREFTSIKHLSEYCGVHEKTITARLRRGFSVEKACEKIDLRHSLYEHQGETKPLCQICKEEEKDYYLVSNRLKYGYSLEKALNKKKIITRQGNPYYCLRYLI